MKPLAKFHAGVRWPSSVRTLLLAWTRSYSWCGLAPTPHRPISSSCCPIISPPLPPSFPLCPIPQGEKVRAVAERSKARGSALVRVVAAARRVRGVTCGGGKGCFHLFFGLNSQLKG